MTEEFEQKVIEYLDKIYNAIITKSENPQTPKKDIKIEEEIEYDGKTFKTWEPCKYKCGYWTAWGNPYKKGDRKLHLNPMTKEILGYECPKFQEKEATK